jgi:hypothetical protein
MAFVSPSPGKPFATGYFQRWRTAFDGMSNLARESSSWTM